MMPAQKPGKSKQDYRTPLEVIRAAKYLVGSNFVWDLAADGENSIVPGQFYNEVEDALTLPWNKGDWVWCNPPFANIEPWVHKAWLESMNWGAHVCMLVPASIGADWWTKYVDGKAQVFALHGRIKFVGCTDYYPKDCAILLYSPYRRGGYTTFDWREAKL